MDNEPCPFQPCINPRSRRLARHAPTLRERQAQVEAETQAERQQQQQQHHAVSPPRANTATRARSSHVDDATASVCALWRAVAKRNAGPVEAACLNSAERLPPVVHVSAVLGMLDAIGIRAPEHDALIAKFLTAMGVDGRDAAGAEATVDSARFLHVFSTAWRAGIRSRARAVPPTATMRRCAITSTAAEVRSQPTVKPAAAAERASPPHRVPSARTTPTRSRSRSSSSGDEGSEADFLHRRTSSNASAATSPGSSPCAAGDSPPAAEQQAAGLSPSPGPRCPDEARDSHPTASPTTPSRTPHRRSPFAAAPRLITASECGGIRPRSSTLRVLPSNSHLLASTTSRDLKKATRRVPGGLMRECTFRPVINEVSKRSSAAIVQRRPSPVRDGGGFEAAVGRMIAARKQLQQPAAQEKSATARTPLLHVDVVLPHGRQDRLTLYTGDDPHDVAERFGILHGLNAALTTKLATALVDQLRRLA